MKIGGVDCFVVGSSTSTNSIIIFTDIFGHTFSNVQQNASKFAQAGFRVFVPDLFGGEKIPYTIPFKGESVMPFIGRHPVDLNFGKKLITSIRDECKLSSIQVVGYCYGAKYVVGLCSEDLVKSGVVAHPSMLVAEDAEKIKQPMCFLCAEKDQAFFPELKSTFETRLKARGIENAFYTYPGTSHGFAVRVIFDPNVSAETLAAVNLARQQAMDQGIAFFKAHV